MTTSATGATSAGRPDQARSVPTPEPARFDPAHVDPAQLDPAQLDPAQLDPAQLDSTQLDMGGADAGVGAAMREAAGRLDERPVDSHPTEGLGDAAEAPALTMELPPADRPADGAPHACPVCGTAAQWEDDFCQTCGLRLTNDRDHYSEQPGRTVAAVSDRGLRHPINQDAAATDEVTFPGTSPDSPVRRRILVVCDGVTTAPDSELASLVAARAAREVLRDRGGTDRHLAMVETLNQAVRAAHEEILRQTGPDSPAATTIAAAVLEDTPPVGPTLAGWASVGDSRVYWLPDAPGVPRLLSVDDSIAQFRVEAGVPRDRAETGPGAHTITGWIGGGGAPELRPRVELVELDAPGWLCVCSDGLWNSCSDPGRLRDLVARLGTDLMPGALARADALVGWANGQGGRDNVTVALARLG